MLVLLLSESGFAGLKDEQDCKTVVIENYGNVLFVIVVRIYEVERCSFRSRFTVFFEGL